MKIFTMLAKYKKILVFLFWILLWQLLSLGMNKLQLFPTPLMVGKRVVELLGTGDFYFSVGKTFLRISLGFLLAVMIGIGLSICTYYSKVLYAIISPFMSVIRSVPVVSFIILALVFLGPSNTVVLCSFLMVMPLIWSSMSTGFKNIPVEMKEMSRVYGFSKRQKLKYIALPNCYSYLVNATTSGMGFAWKSGIAAEVLGSPALSIGRELFYAKTTFDFIGLFAWTFIIILFSLVMERITKILDKSLRERI